MAQALVGLARDPARAEETGAAGRARQQRVVLDRGDDARICASSWQTSPEPSAWHVDRCSGHAVTDSSRTERATRSRPGRLADRAAMGRMDHRADRRHERVRARRGGTGSRRACRARRRLGHRAVRGTGLTGCTSGSTGGSLVRAAAMRDTDLSRIACGRTSSSAIGPLDAVVSFLPAERTAWDGPAPRYGVWADRPHGRWPGRPARRAASGSFAGRTGTATAAVVALDDGFTRVIAQDSARADPLSLTRTRNAAAWTSARLVLALPAPAPAGRRPRPELRTALAEPRNLPPPPVTVRHAARTAIRGVAAKSRTAWRRDEWFVAVRRRSTDGRDPARCAHYQTPRAVTWPTRSRSRSTAGTSSSSRITRTRPVAERSRSSKPGRTTRGRRRAGCSNASITSPTRSCSSTRGRSTCFRRPAKRAESNSTAPLSFRISGGLTECCSMGSPPSTPRCISRMASSGCSQTSSKAKRTGVSCGCSLRGHWMGCGALTRGTRS